LGGKYEAQAERAFWTATISNTEKNDIYIYVYMYISRKIRELEHQSLSNRILH
jgi:hypothetical protein